MENISDFGLAILEYALDVIVSVTLLAALRDQPLKEGTGLVQPIVDGLDILWEVRGDAFADIGRFERRMRILDNVALIFLDRLPNIMPEDEDLRLERRDGIAPGRRVVIEKIGSSKFLVEGFPLAA